MSFIKDIFLEIYKNYVKLAFILVKLSPLVNTIKLRIKYKLCSVRKGRVVTYIKANY